MCTKQMDRRKRKAAPPITSVFSKKSRPGNIGMQTVNNMNSLSGPGPSTDHDDSSDEGDHTGKFAPVST